MTLITCEAVMELSRLGFRFRLDGEAVKVRFEGKQALDPAKVLPLLTLVKEHKAEMISFLAQKSKVPERVLTCCECSHFRPAINSPNPAQAWGHCKKMDKGRYGVATACETVLNSPAFPGTEIYPSQEKRRHVG